MARAITAGALTLTLAAAGCTSSGGTKTTAPAPSTSHASTASSSAPAANAPIMQDGITTATNTRVQKLIPLLPGVQNVAFELSTNTITIYFHPNATRDERAVVVSQLRTLLTPVKAKTSVHK